MKAHLAIAALFVGLVAASCGRDPLLTTPRGVDDGGPGGFGGSWTGGRGGSGGRGPTGTGGTPADAALPDVSPGQFPLVLLPAETPPLPVGRSFRLRALVRLNEAWRDLGNDVMISWRSDNPGICAVAAGNGRLTGMAPGKTLVRATHPLFGTAQATITVTPSQLERVTITPDPAEVMVAQNKQLAALATYDDGTTALVTDAAVWASADQRLLHVQTGIPPIGELTAIIAGNVNVTADFAGTVGVINVMVRGSGAPVLSIAPPATSLVVGSTTRFQALLRQPTGVATDVSSLSVWASSNASVARSLGAGQVRCMAAGQSAISVSHMGQSVSAALVCTAAGSVTLKELRILPSGANAPLFVMARYGLMLEAISSDGTTTSVSSANQISWSSSDEAIAVIDGNATLLGRMPGMVTITARYAGLETSEQYTFVAR